MHGRVKASDPLRVLIGSSVLMLGTGDDVACEGGWAAGPWLKVEGGVRKSSSPRFLLAPYKTKPSLAQRFYLGRRGRGLAASRGGARRQWVGGEWPAGKGRHFRLLSDGNPNSMVMRAW